MNTKDMDLKLTDHMERQLVEQELAGRPMDDGDEVDARIVRWLVVTALMVATVLLTIPLI